MRLTQVSQIFFSVQRYGRGFKPMRGTGDKGTVLELHDIPFELD